MVLQLINANPVVYERQERRTRVRQPADDDEYAADPIDQLEVFVFCGNSLFFCGGPGGCFISLTNLNHIRDIKDPEHPYTLEELKVVSENAIEVDDKQSYVRVTFTPTVEHCSMATLIGLSIRVKLMRSLPSRYKVDIRVAPGTHATESAVNKQLNDKERVAAALENPNLVDMVEECLAQTYL